MKKHPLETLLASTILILILVMLVVIVKALSVDRTFDYEDFYGQIGTSKDCFRKESKLFCRLDNGEALEVVRYKSK